MFDSDVCLRLIRDGVVAEVRRRIGESIERHGSWKGYSDEEIRNAVAEEFIEFHTASFDGVVGGAHGQIDELIDVATVAIKGAAVLLSRGADE